MKLYLLQDQKSNQFVKTYLFENADCALRNIRSEIASVIESKNKYAIAIYQDCKLLELDLDGLVFNKVSDLSVFFSTPESVKKDEN